MGLQLRIWTQQLDVPQQTRAAIDRKVRLALGRYLASHVAARASHS